MESVEEEDEESINSQTPTENQDTPSPAERECPI
jgi:hypothetical protein